MLPTALVKYSIDEVRAALAIVGAGGPFTEDSRRLLQYLHVYGYAHVTTHMHRTSPTVLQVDVVSAELTPRGRDLWLDLTRAD